DFGSLATLAYTLRNGYFHAGTYSSFRRRRHGRAAASRPVSHWTTGCRRRIRIGHSSTSKTSCRPRSSRAAPSRS
ncbi:hypothetical protein GR255_16680, partial [Mycobacterium tuberculosis]|nr:hypothetical protein [Mycobacterium tuberculosis]